MYKEYSQSAFLGFKNNSRKYCFFYFAKEKAPSVDGARGFTANPG
jgi:hypothetical protein